MLVSARWLVRSSIQLRLQHQLQAWTTRSLVTLLSGLLLGTILSVSAFGQDLITPPQFQRLPATHAASQAVKLRPAEVNDLSSASQNRLDQFNALLQEQHWETAFELADSLSTDQKNQIVSLTPERMVSLRTYYQIQLALLPTNAITIYRKRVDPIAKKWLERGRATQDETLLQQIVDRFFCSSWSDDALMTLSAIAMERGDSLSARRSLQMILPQAAAGRQPGWFSVNDATSLEPTADELRCPGSSIPPAEILARLMLISIREQNFDRAAFELDTLNRLYPKSEGHLAGKDAKFTETLTNLLQWAKESPALTENLNWPTFGGSATRVKRTMPLGPLSEFVWTQAIDDFELRVESNAEKFGPWMAPIISDGQLLLNSGNKVWAFDVATGEPAVQTTGQVYELRNIQRTQRPSRIRFLNSDPTEPSSQTQRPFYSLSCNDGIAYATLRITNLLERSSNMTSFGKTIVGLDMQREGLLSVRIRPDTNNEFFIGSPVVERNRFYVAVYQQGVQGQLFVACYNASTGQGTAGQLLWKRLICRTAAGDDNNLPGRAGGLLTLAGDSIYCNTNQGIIAALAKQDGRVRWLRRYDRIDQVHPDRLPHHFARGMSPCLVDSDSLFVAPADSPSVFAIDPSTGQLRWESTQLADATHLLGVSNGLLIATGVRCCGLDIRTGKLRYCVPKKPSSELHGVGRGLLAGDQIVWPTRRVIHLLDSRTGESVQPPISLQPISTNGANLAAWKNQLVIVGTKGIALLGNNKIKPKKDDKP